eukprot:gb/GECH01011404.1/.p1 GENE.gb/GECH01011404.1/~~gb/GECH01011404.1/.p1  ORF type:complete len:300 (+),score=81.59 gb/GECH01011404.1/:1-900(+)
MSTEQQSADYEPIAQSSQGTNDHQMHNPDEEEEEEVSIFEKAFRAIIIFLCGILCILILPFTIRIIKEYERGVIFRLGRCVGAKGPGLFIMLPCVDTMVKVDLRTVTLDVPEQEVITKDSVTVRVDAVVYFHVFKPVNSVVKVTNYSRSTYLLSQTTLRSVIGGSNLDDLLTSRESINEKLKQQIDTDTDPWGVKVSLVEIKGVQLPTNMQRVMASQAEAERERRAKIISADGEFQASSRIAEAAKVMSSQPATMQLRYLQTLMQISEDQNHTFVVPLPIDVMRNLAGKNNPPKAIKES